MSSLQPQTAWALPPTPAPHRAVSQQAAQALWGRAPSVWPVAGSATGLQTRPPGEAGPFAREALSLFSSVALFSINETVPSHHSFSLSRSVTVLWELGQRATLSSSVRYKVKTKTNRQAKNSLQRDTFDPGIFSPIGQLASMA